MLERIRLFPSKVNRFLHGLIERKRMKSRLKASVDMWPDKSGAIRFHIRQEDGRIIATSNPYHDLTVMENDLNTLIYGSVRVESN